MNRKWPEFFERNIYPLSNEGQNFYGSYLRCTFYTDKHSRVYIRAFLFIVYYILQIFSVQYFFREIINFSNFEKILISIIEICCING